MKHTSIIFLTLALGVSGTFAACASGDEDPPFGPTQNDGDSDPDPTPSATPDAGTPPPDPTTPPPRTCAPQCTSDQDCQDSCPVATAPNCCDTATGTCFVSDTASCPVPEDPTQPPPSY